ncbi:hypothetical protein [Methylobacterium sp. CM6257]
MLAFNLFGLIARDRVLATRFVTELLPGPLNRATDAWFEYSQGRGDARFTSGCTAFDVVPRRRASTGARALILIEMQYRGAGHNASPHPALALPRSRANTGPSIAADDPAPTGPASQQLYR